MEEIIKKLEEFKVEIPRLIKDAQGKRDPDYLNEKLSRWRDRVTDFVSKNISTKEVEKIRLAAMVTFSSNDVWSYATELSKAFHNYITALIEEVTNNPEFYLKTQDPSYVPNNTTAETPVSVVEKICKKFHTVARQLRSRHGHRPTLDVTDEYDVQDLLHSLLKIHFSDIRPEESTPSYAGGNSRTDFLLKKEQVVIEVKKTRENLADKEIGEQLMIDIERYQLHPNCKSLVCFVYDPEGRIGNPDGLIADLEGRKRDKLNVRVIIEPST